MENAVTDDLTEGPISFKEVTESDLAFILSAEQGAKEGRFVGGWSRAEHHAAMRDGDVAYWLIRVENRPVGFVILRGPRGKDGSFELKRIVLTETGKGYGRAALRLIKRITFKSLKAYRLWLDVFEHNSRARHLYLSEGFVVEGTLRECVKQGDGFASLTVMSMLGAEYRDIRPTAATS